MNKPNVLSGPILPKIGKFEFFFNFFYSEINQNDKIHKITNFF